MRYSHRRRAALSWASVVLLLTYGTLSPTDASAQAESDRTWAAVPLLGFGVIRVNESWNSGGVEAALELEHRRAGWQWSGYASVRGLGVGCSEACFDGGPAVALGISRSIGAFWLGGGAGYMKQLGRWRPLPHARASIDSEPFRFGMRVEFPRQDGSGVYFPILVGVPFRVPVP